METARICYRFSSSTSPLKLVIKYYILLLLLQILQLIRNKIHIKKKCKIKHHSTRLIPWWSHGNASLVPPPVSASVTGVNTLLEAGKGPEKHYHGSTRGTVVEPAVKSNLNWSCRFPCGFPLEISAMCEPSRTCAGGVFTWDFSPSFISMAKKQI